MPQSRIVKSYDRPLIEQAAAILRKTPTDHVSADRLASKVGMSSAKLREGFKILYKTTIYQFRLNLCLDMAKALLEETDLSIADIARRTGFSCRRSFGRCFSQKFHLSPKDWRNQSVFLSEPKQAKVTNRSIELIVEYCPN
jgi:transcriptional regulator GlxA family with amidase domain